ncbi:MAG: hypothetical protein IPJ66_18010 [Bacteroidetes bacterium]|nr:hypothetical protein [Bacteroidota bacterium]
MSREEQWKDEQIEIILNFLEPMTHICRPDQTNHMHQKKPMKIRTNGFDFSSSRKDEGFSDDGNGKPEQCQDAGPQRPHWDAESYSKNQDISRISCAVQNPVHLTSDFSNTKANE